MFVYQSKSPHIKLITLQSHYQSDSTLTVHQLIWGHSRYYIVRVGLSSVRCWFGSVNDVTSVFVSFLTGRKILMGRLRWWRSRSEGYHSNPSIQSDRWWRMANILVSLKWGKYNITMIFVLSFLSSDVKDKFAFLYLFLSWIFTYISQ